LIVSVLGARVVFVSVLGTTEGSNDIVAWKEAAETALTLSGLDQTHGCRIAITAVNKAGLFTTHRFHVQ